jgi:hypothetical protein
MERDALALFQAKGVRTDMDYDSSSGGCLSGLEFGLESAHDPRVGERLRSDSEHLSLLDDLAVLGRGCRLRRRAGGATCGRQQQAGQ